jgi:hypothetical protein
MAACPARVIALLAADGDADRRREYLLRLPLRPRSTLALGTSRGSSWITARLYIYDQLMEYSITRMLYACQM